MDRRTVLLLGIGLSLHERFAEAFGQRGIEVVTLQENEVPDFMSKRSLRAADDMVRVSPLMFFDEFSVVDIPPDRVKGPKGPRGKWGKLK